METNLWELRLTDGRGASFYTTADVTAYIGALGVTRTIPVADRVFEGGTAADAATCFDQGLVAELTAHMGAVAYALRHVVP